MFPCDKRQYYFLSLPVTIKSKTDSGARTNTPKLHKRLRTVSPNNLQHRSRWINISSPNPNPTLSDVVRYCNEKWIQDRKDANSPGASDPGRRALACPITSSLGTFERSKGRTYRTYFTYHANPHLILLFNRQINGITNGKSKLKKVSHI